MTNPRLVWMTAVAIAIASGGTLLLALQSGAPHVGFDFAYFLPRLLDVYLHQLQEGWIKVQWWTPSFGAGLPAFFNPQHTQFMLAQGLLPWVGPWKAAVLQAALFNALGSSLVFWVCWRRWRQDLGAAALAAISFGTCGFMWEHALTGHMGFNVFPLVAVIPEALHRDVPASRGVAWIALAATVIVFGGGYTVILIFALTGAMLAPLLLLLRSGDYTIATVFGRLALGAAFACGAGAVKLIAVAQFLSRFPRLVSYTFEGSDALALPSLVWQLFGRRALLCLTRWLPFSGNEAAGWFGRGEDVGFGPLAAIVLLGGGWLLLRRAAPVSAGRGTLLCASVLAIWLAAECSTGRGLVWPLLKPLPFLRSLHENHRLTASFALPLALAIAPCWTALLQGLAPRTVAAVTSLACLLTLASLDPYFRNRGGFWHGSYDASPINRTWARLRSDPGERFPIKVVADIRDDAGFLAGASSWKPYEPIFGYGYGGAQFRVQLSPGPITPLSPEHHTWRFHDPRCFVQANCEAFAPWTSGSEADLRLLLARHQPKWDLPAGVRPAGVASLAILAALALAALAPRWSSLDPLASSAERSSPN